MHKARIKRHGHPGLKIGPSLLEKLPHPIVDEFIKKSWSTKYDEEISGNLRKMGFKGATIWTVKYRRRKLGFHKYLSGEIQKHKAWIRAQAIKTYGKKCEICGYSLSIDTHHIIAKAAGGKHEINNLIVICPNCHALVTRRLLSLKDRGNLPKVRRELRKLLQGF